MKRFLTFLAIALMPALAMALPSNEWQYRQTINIPAPGLLRLNLPAETLSAARPDLADLRIFDAHGAEVPYLLDQPRPRSESSARPKDFRPEIGFKQTVLHITTGTDDALAGVVLDVPAGARFTKAARVEGSRDEINWQVLIDGAPLFRTNGEAGSVRVSFPEGPWRFLRVLVDDARSEPVPITGAELILSRSPAPAEPIAIRMESREENSGVTRIALDLGAANLLVASLKLQTADPLFTRHVTVAAPALSNDKLEEQTIATAVVYRAETNDENASQLEIPLERFIAGRELILFIENGEESPLALNSINGTRRITRLFFTAAGAGTYTLLSGNDQCAAAKYDLGQLHERMRAGSAIDVTLSPLGPNPSYTAPSAPIGGAVVDLTPWKFRKPLLVTKAGAQEIELDPAVLAQSTPDLRDLRIVQSGSENVSSRGKETTLPFLIETTSSLRAVPLAARKENERSVVSRWSLKMPQAGLPITRLTCASSSPIFERSARLWEEIADERGEKYPRELGHTAWRRQATRPIADLFLPLEFLPRSGTLLLDIDDGDNAAIDLHDFRVSYPVTKLLFRATAAQSLWLCYGNNEAVAPHYDLSLIAEQLLRAERTRPVVGPSEELKTSAAIETLSGFVRYIFWLVLAVVVIALLLLISRLLPKPAWRET